MTDMSAASAEAAAIASARMPGSNRRKMVMGINVGPYAGFKVPGIDRTAIFSQPHLMLKNPNPTSQYCWRKPDDQYTSSMVERHIMRPVTGDEVDRTSRFANIELRRILTQDGPKKVVRTPGGLGLFEIINPAQMNNEDQGDVSGEHWEKAYLAELAGSEDRFAEDMEQVTHTALQGRVTGELTSKDTAREQVV
jgi:hypothetical protein